MSGINRIILAELAKGGKKSAEAIKSAFSNANILSEKGDTIESKEY